MQASADDSPLPNAPHVYVEGSAEATTVPDYMVLTVYYQAGDAVTETAKTQVDERTRSLLDACAALQIADDDIVSTSLTINPRFAYDENDHPKPSGTQVSRAVTITLRDLAQYSKLVAAVIASKPAAISDAQLKSMHADEWTARAQIDALADARARAQRLAEAAHTRLGRVYSISEFSMRNEEAMRLSPGRAIVTGAVAPYGYGSSNLAAPPASRSYPDASPQGPASTSSIYSRSERCGPARKTA
jgi:uncharacterized protein YggE